MPTPRSPDDVDCGRELTGDDFRGQARHVARNLVGTLLLVEDDAAAEGSVGGLIVEAEAYVNAVDPACHLAGGRTPRTEPFFAGPGTIYVYAIHGHDMLNVITAYEGYPEGILLRALEPTHGRDVMRERRGHADPGELTSGPGKLTEALGVTREEFDGEALADVRLSVHATGWEPEVTVSKRVGVTSAEDWPLRFTAAENPFVSRPPVTEGLDEKAVDGAYRRLEEGAEVLPRIDG